MYVLYMCDWIFISNAPKWYTQLVPDIHSVSISVLFVSCVWCLPKSSLGGCSGSVPSEDRGTCEHCPAWHYSVSGADTCWSCDVPLLLVDNDCVSWHQSEIKESEY